MGKAANVNTTSQQYKTHSMIQIHSNRIGFWI